jgi:hypothetical protein
MEKSAIINLRNSLVEKKHSVVAKEGEREKSFVEAYMELKNLEREKLLCKGLSGDLKANRGNGEEESLRIEALKSLEEELKSIDKKVIGVLDYLTGVFPDRFKMEEAEARAKFLISKLTWIKGNPCKESWLSWRQIKEEVENFPRIRSGIYSSLKEVIHEVGGILVNEARRVNGQDPITVKKEDTDPLPGEVVKNTRGGFSFKEGNKYYSLKDMNKLPAHLIKFRTEIEKQMKEVEASEK